ncbi:polysaccharide deacetylase family protein [Actinacidiphila alni]|uniref:polysaccharide deacetylase family protein n=1 Tax=Actinacidiphila alni TaxID=380248 RepID=UPI00345225F2
MEYKTGRSGFPGRTAVRRTAAAVATAALAGAALAACGGGAGHGAAAAGDDGRGGTRAPSAGASTPGIPSQRTAPPNGGTADDSGGSDGTATSPDRDAPTGGTGPDRTGTGPSGTVPSQTVPGGSTAPGTTPPTTDGTDLSGTRPAESIQHSLEDGGKSVALTFDDGPDPRWTPQVLALLARHHAKATFCEIGPNAAAHPGLVRRITAEGHRLCDHSVHHDERQSGKSLAYNAHEIADAQRDIAKAAGPGAKLWYYRAPGGDFTPPIRRIAADHGLRPLGWTVDSRDWERPGTAKVLATIGRELRPGSIVLMHDGGGDRRQTVAALAKLLDTLDAQGWTYSFPAR